MSHHFQKLQDSRKHKNASNKSIDKMVTGAQTSDEPAADNEKEMSDQSPSADPANIGVVVIMFRL